MNSICENIQNLQSTIRPKQLGDVSDTSMRVYSKTLRPVSAIIRRQVLSSVRFSITALVEGELQYE